MAPCMFSSIARDYYGQTCFPQHFPPKLIFEKRRQLSFIASRQLVSSKQELHFNDLECAKDWLL